MIEGKAWLQHFEGSDRARAGRLFYQAVRDGADEPRKACSALFLKVGRRLKEPEMSDDERRLLTLVRHWMNEDRPGAMVLAQFCLDWESATPEQRARMVEKKKI